MQRHYRIICERTDNHGIREIKQLYTWDALEANTLAGEYISNGWLVTIDVEKHYDDNAPEAEVINLFDKARQRKPLKGAKEILQDAATRNIANKKRMEAERHRTNNKTLQLYNINKGGKK